MVITLQKGLKEYVEDFCSEESLKKAKEWLQSPQEANAERDEGGIPHQKTGWLRGEFHGARECSTLEYTSSEDKVYTLLRERAGDAEYYSKGFQHMSV